MDSRIDDNNANRRILTPSESDIKYFGRKGNLVLPLGFSNGFSSEECFIDLSGFAEPQIYQINGFNSKRDLPWFYWSKGAITGSESDVEVVLSAGRMKFKPKDIFQRGGSFDLDQKIKGLACRIGIERPNGTFEIKFKPEYR